MAVPKKRTGHSAQGHRRSNWKAVKQEITHCSNCGAAVLTHTVCTACGTYKGKPVSLKDRKDDAPVKTETKHVKVKESSVVTNNVETVEEIKVEHTESGNTETNENPVTEEVSAESEEISTEELSTEEINEDKAD